MKGTLTCILATSIAFSPVGTTPNASHAETAKVVHLVVINMSGSARELHHREDVVTLPVATRIPVQIPAGDKIRIESKTDTRVGVTITVNLSDEGRVLPIR